MKGLVFPRALKTVMTSRVTFRFLAVLLAALGLAQSDAIGSAMEATVCLLLGGCVG